jgi:hypothetical protein
MIADAADESSSNVVVAFKPKPAPELNFAEFRLDEDGLCGLQLTLVDETNNVVAVLEYKLVDAPADFDLDRLRQGWARWRGTSTKAS